MKVLKAIAFAAGLALAFGAATRAVGLPMLVGPAGLRGPLPSRFLAESRRAEPVAGAIRRASAPEDLPPKASRPLEPARAASRPARDYVARLPRLSAGLMAHGVLMPWQVGRGVRLRLIYLRPLAEVEGDAAGFWIRYPGKPARFLEAWVPIALRRSFPIYRSGSVFNYAIELENVSRRSLRRLRLAARQEAFVPSGDAGRPLGPATAPIDIAELKPGETTVVELHGRLGTEPLQDVLPVDFEQTHVLLVRESGGERVIMINAPHAGIVDPPR